MDLSDDIAALWRYYETGHTRSLEWRLRQIDGITDFIRRCEPHIMEALRADLAKPAFEAYASDVGGVLGEFALLRKHLPRLMKPRRVRTPLRSQPGRSLLYPEPYGAVLLLPAWNYPVGLTVLPLAGAVAGGNTVAIKPSEMAPASATVIAEHLPRFVDDEAIRVFEGGPETAEELLRHRFGHIHYTGSGRVGRIVMAAAAAHLTPVTLELGGKNPAYVHGDTDVAIASKRIMFGRCFNAGQTCVSPDYAMVDRRIAPAFIDGLVDWTRRAYGQDARNSPDLARMANGRQFRRVAKLLEGAEKIVVGGQHDEESLYIAPTVVVLDDLDHPLMHEEIFGPILPVLVVDGLDDAIGIMNGKPQPLTMYVFTDTDAVANKIIGSTSAGSVVVNQMFTQASNAALPFGGVGESGMGAYTGLHSFDCFTHMKPVAKSPIRPDIPLLYPPYGKWQTKIVRKALG